MMDKTIIKNYLFNSSYQILALIVPLITTPYISRVLHADGIGMYSYTYSIVSYFVLCAVLGTATYGNRKIGILQQNPIERTKKFWDIFWLRFVLSSIAILLYCLYVIFFARDKIIATLQSFYLLGVICDVSWFFQGMEDFKQIAIRNYLFKIINVVCVFVFIKSENDLWKYVLMLSFLTWLGNISIWPYLKKYLVKVGNYVPKPFAEFKIIFQMFLPTAAMQVYAMLDKTMIGVFTTENVQNGYYEQSEKIVKMCLMLVTGLSTVMIPKISKAYAENNKEEAKRYLYKSYNFIWFLGTPLLFGVIGVTPMLVPVFFGKGFEPVEYILPVMSLLFIIMGLNQTTGSQFFISSGRQNEYTKRIVMGGIVNIACNICLIPVMGALGAAIASVVGEIVIMFTLFAYIQKHGFLSIRKILRMSKKYMLAGIIMGILLSWLGTYLAETVRNLVLLITCGGIVYLVVLLFQKEATVSAGFNFVFGKIVKR